LLATAALAAGAVAVQFVPGVDLAVDVAAAGGAVAEGAAGGAAASSAAAASGVAAAAGVVERAASPLLGKAGAFLASHAKSLGRDVGIGIAADLITKMIDRAAGAGHDHDPVASAAAACATGRVASVHIKEDTRDVSVSCK